jgi:hypothetical protein
MLAETRLGAGFGCDLEHKGECAVGGRDWGKTNRNWSSGLLVPDMINKPEVEFRFVGARTEYLGGKRVLAGAGVRNEGDFLGEF